MFGEMLKMMRKSRNLNQVQLAAQLNVTKQTISNWENNNILPSIDMLVKISHYFSVSTDYLLELDNRFYLEQKKGPPHVFVRQPLFTLI